MVMRYGNSSHFKTLFLWDVMPYIFEEPTASIFRGRNKVYLKHGTSHRSYSAQHV
jgi:hypothetical protein